MSAWKHLRAILLLPGMATVIVPALILSSGRNARPGWSLAYPFSLLTLLLGLALIGFGITLMVQTIHLFMSFGNGTLAPWDPTHKLVVRGVYRYVRNPMISGVFCVLLGQAVLFGSMPLFYWFAAFVIVNLIYIPLLEEPSLADRFGRDYLQYRENVPRWVPRLHPWQPPWDHLSDRTG